MDEFDLIRWIRERQPPFGDGVGIGDDCAVFDTPSDRHIVVSVDTFLEGVHFEWESATPQQAGYKAMAAALSDIAAMGCPAWGALTAVTLTRGKGEELPRGIQEGLEEAARPFGVQIVGGNVSSWDQPVAISVTVIGRDAGLSPVRRSGAQVGDVLCVTGELGGSILGRHLRFIPRLKEGEYLNRRYELHSMIDLSDGLSSDLGHILEESGVGGRLYEDWIPVSADARTLAAKTGKSPLEHALNDGEDFELLFSVSKEEAERIRQDVDFGVKVTCVGEIIPSGMQWVRPDGTAEPVGAKGYTHRL